MTASPLLPPAAFRDAATRWTFRLLLPAAAVSTASYMAAAGTRALVWAFLTGFMPFALAAVYGMHLLLSRSREEFRRLATVGVFAATVGTAMGIALQFDRTGFPLQIAATLCGVSLLFQRSEIRRSSSVVRQELSRRFAETLILALAVGCTPFFLWLSSLIPRTYDLHVYAFEAGYGFQPSAVAVRWSSRIPGAQVAFKAIYDALPLALGVLHALRNRRRVAESVLIVFVGTTVVGYALYFVFPVAGVQQVFGVDFPNHLPSIAGMTIAPVAPLLPGPRNGMPSLHAAWAYLIWFNAAPLPKRLRLGFRVFVALTLVATVALRDAHWLTDLVVALPMAVAVQAVLGTTGPARARRHTALGSALLVVAWLLLLRFGTGLVIAAPAIAWLAAVVSTAASLFLYRRLVPKRR